MHNSRGLPLLLSLLQLLLSLLLLLLLLHLLVFLLLFLLVFLLLILHLPSLSFSFYFGRNIFTLILKHTHASYCCRCARTHAHVYPRTYMHTYFFAQTCTKNSHTCTHTQRETPSFINTHTHTHHACKYILAHTCTQKSSLIYAHKNPRSYMHTCKLISSLIFIRERLPHTVIDRPRGKAAHSPAMNHLSLHIAFIHILVFSNKDRKSVV